MIFGELSSARIKLLLGYQFIAINAEQDTRNGFAKLYSNPFYLQFTSKSGVAAPLIRWTHVSLVLVTPINRLVSTKR